MPKQCLINEIIQNICKFNILSSFGLVLYLECYSDAKIYVVHLNEIITKNSIFKEINLKLFGLMIFTIALKIFPKNYFIYKAVDRNLYL